jgi:hypothetical protein
MLQFNHHYRLGWFTNRAILDAMDTLTIASPYIIPTVPRKLDQLISAENSTVLI